MTTEIPTEDLVQQRYQLESEIEQMEKDGADGRRIAGARLRLTRITSEIESRCTIPCPNPQCPKNFATAEEATDCATRHLTEPVPVPASATSEALDELRVCACGCGGAVKRGRTWRQGHDSRLKGALHKLEEGEITEDDLAQQFPAELLKSLATCTCCGAKIAAHPSGLGPTCRKGNCSCATRMAAAAPSS